MQSVFPFSKHFVHLVQFQQRPPLPASGDEEPSEQMSFYSQFLEFGWGFKLFNIDLGIFLDNLLYLGDIFIWYTKVVLG